MASFEGIDRLRAAAIDGRTDNVRYRQNQLQSLSKSLRNNAERITAAISEDVFGTAQGTNTEVQCEFYLTSDVIQKLYQTLNFEKSIVDEYNITKGTDLLSRRVGKGLVIIRPTTHTRFYSIICPIATAITAGNCVCLEVCK